MAPNKLVGPTICLVFLGMLIDTTHMETSPPGDKLYESLVQLQSWSYRKNCCKSKLLLLISKLNFACQIIPAGYIFFNRLIDLSTIACLLHHHVTINCEARPNIDWWLRFLPGWNGHAIIADPTRQEHWIWNFSLMLPEVLAMASSMQATGLLTPGLHNFRIEPSNGKTFTPLLSHVFSGVISGLEKAPLPL